MKTAAYTILAAAAIALLPAASATAAAPRNNNYASATSLNGISGMQTGTNVDATYEATYDAALNNYCNSEDDAALRPKTVWFKWMPTTSAKYQIDTRGSDFDTMIAVYKGKVSATAEPAALDDDNGGDGTSKVVIETTAYSYHYICVSGWKDATGNIKLNWKPLPAFAAYVEDGIATSYDGICPEGAQLVIPDGTTKIADFAFVGCEGLAKVTIPASVEYIGEEAFYGCASLEEVVFLGDRDAIEIDETAFGDTPWGDSQIEYVFNYYENDDGTVTICSEEVYNEETDEWERIPAVSPSPEGNLAIPAEIDGMPVACIGYEAFYKCEGLTSVTIPDGVEDISHSAFLGCSNFTAFNVAAGNPRYKSVNGLLLSKDGKWLVMGVNGDVAIPDGVEYIDWKAFYGCAGLTSVTIPDSVASIDEDAFYGCTGLTSVTIPDSVTGIGWDAFGGCDESLYDKTTVPGVLLVDGWAIGCDEEVELEGHLDLSCARGIADDAFESCSGLTSVTIGDGVKSIGGWAFGDCTGLTSITIPASVKYIGWRAFADCENLDNVTFAGDIDDIYIKPGAFFYTPFNDRQDFKFTICQGVLTGFLGCRPPENIVIPDGVTRIDEEALSGNDDGDSYMDNVVSVEIPDSVEWIDEEAFCYCSGLTSVTIGGGVKSIGGWAFGDCTGLTSITIPASVKYIGRSAFADCESLATVVFEGDRDAIEIEESAFEYTPWGDSQIEYAFDCEDNGDGTVTIRGVNPRPRGDFAIPAEIDDKPVAGIGDQVFHYCYRLKSVTIPDNVKYIEYGAFYGCNDLTGVTIGSGVEYIGEEAFADCENLEEVVFLGDKDAIDIDDTAFDGTPWGDSNIEYIFNYEDNGDGTVTIYGINPAPRGDFAIPAEIDGKPVARIADWVFENCDRLKSVTIPDSVKYIGYGAFYNCYRLTDITIPANVEYIGKEAFQECRSLGTVTFEGSEENIYIQTGAFLDTPYARALPFEPQIDGNGTLLGFYGTAPETLDLATADRSVYSIQIWFSDYPEIRALRIPASVQYIYGNYVFAYSNLQLIVMPKKWRERIENGEYMLPDGCTVKYYTPAICSVALDPNGGVFASDRTMAMAGADYTYWQNRVDIEKAELDELLGDGGAYTAAALACYDARTNLRHIENEIAMVQAVLDTATTQSAIAKAKEDLKTLGEYRDTAIVALDNAEKAFDDAQAALWEAGSVVTKKSITAFEKTLVSLEYADIRLERVQALFDVQTLAASVEEGTKWGDIDWIAWVSGKEGLPTPEREGYLFGGWFTEREGGIKATENTAVTGYTTLYARWLEPTPLPADAPVLSDGMTTSTNAGVPESADPLSCLFDFPARTVWWKWTAPIDCEVEFMAFETTDEDFYPVLGAFLADGTCITAKDYDRISFTAAKDETYYIGVGGYEGSTGPFALSWLVESREAVVVYEPAGTTVAANGDGTWTVAPADGGAPLTQETLDEIEVQSYLEEYDEYVDSTRGFAKTLNADGTATIAPRAPEMPPFAKEYEIGAEGDASGMLADATLVDLAAEPETEAGETIAALPVEAVAGLYYRASWGGSLDGMRAGEFVQATKDGGLYLGVIMQKGAAGFYRVEVSATKPQ